MQDWNDERGNNWFEIVYGLELRKPNLVKWNFKDDKKRNENLKTWLQQSITEEAKTLRDPKHVIDPEL